MRNTAFLHSTIHENSYEIYSFFREKRSVYFDASGYNTFNKKNIISQKSDRSSSEEEKEKAKKEKIEAGLFTTEEKKLRKILEALSGAEEKGEREKVEKLKKEYEEVKKKLEYSGVFEVIKDNVFEKLTYDTKEQVTNILGVHDKNLEAIKQESFQIVLEKVRVNKPFNKNELEHLSRIGVFECIESFSSERDKKIFLNLFAEINAGKSEFVFGVAGLYESLKSDIAVVLERDTVSNAQKKIIFEKFIDFTLIDKKIKNTSENRAKIQKEVISELELENIAFIQQILKQSNVLISSLEMLFMEKKERSNDGEESGGDITASNAKMLKKEKEMLKKVQSILGKDVAQKAESIIQENEEQSFSDRQKAFFTFLNEEIIKTLHVLKTKSLDEVSRFIDRAQKFSIFAIDQMIGFSPKERSIKKENLEHGYSAYFQYIDALRQAERESSSLPVLRFFTEGGKNAEEKEAIKNLNIFSDNDIKIIQRIEKGKKIMKGEMEIEAHQYAVDIDTLNEFLSSSEYLQEYDKNPETAMKKVADLGILTSEGVVEICGKNDKDYHPYFFKKTHAFGKRYNFSARELRDAMGSLESEVLPKGVIVKLSGVQSSDMLSETVYNFFTKDRFSGGVESLVSSAVQVQTDVLDYASETGAFEEGGIIEAMKKEYESFDENEVQKMLETQKRVIHESGDILHDFLKNNNKNNTYTKEIENIFEQIKENYTLVTHAVLVLGDTFSSEKKEFSQKLSKIDDLHNHLDIIIKAMRTFRNLYSKDNASLFLEELRQASVKDSEKGTGGKNMYTVFTRQESDVFLNREVSHEEKQIFHLISQKNALSPQGIMHIQNVMKQKNRAGNFCVEKASHSEYDGETNTIFLSEDVYSLISDFDATNEEDMQKLKSLSENKELQDAFISFLHESVHSFVEKNQEVLFQFSSLLESEFGVEYKNLCKEIQHTYKKENIELSKEEVLAEIGAFLQLDAATREKFLGKSGEENKDFYRVSGTQESLLAKIFAKISEEKLQALFEDPSFNSDGVLKKTGRRQLSTQGRSPEELKILKEYEDADEKAKKIQEEENLKKEREASDPRFFTKEKRLDAEKTFDEAVNKARNFIIQLEDAYPNLSPPAGENLKKAVDSFNSDLENCTDFFHNHSLNNTVKTAGEVTAHVNEKIAGTAKDYAQQLSRFHINDKNIFQNAWDNTRFLSGDNVVDIFKRLWDYVVRRYERKNKGRVGEVGAKMFKGILPGLATDFEKEKNSVDMEEVDQYQGGYKLLNDSDLHAAVYNVSDADAFRAYMTEMASRGLIEWRRVDDRNSSKKIYVEKLKEFGSGVRFYSSDFEGDETFVNTKLQKAFLDVYGDDRIFWDFYKDNKNNINSKTSDAEAVAGVRGGANTQIMEWLYLNKRGEYVNPNEYEGYIKLMVGDGTTHPANYVYYLFAGINDGIISPDSLSRFYGYLGNVFPPFNGLTSWNTEKIKEVMDDVLTDKNGVKHESYEKVPDIWVPWVHANIMTQGNVLERTIINLGQKGAGKFDHDNAHLLASIGDAVTAGQMLAQGSTGNVETKYTVYTQSIYGQVQHILNLANSDSVKFKTLQEEVTRQAGFFSATDALVSSRVDSGKSKFKFTEDILRRKPRSGGDYNGNLTNGDYLNMGRRIYSSVVTPKFKELVDTFLFNDGLNSNSSVFADLWNNELSNDEYVKNVIFAGGSVQKIKNGGGNVDQEYGIIASKIFNHFFKDHPDAHDNVMAVAKAAQNVYFGNGIAGVPDSTEWSKDDATGIPYQFQKYYNNSL